MERIPEVLQLSIIVEGGRPLPFEPELLQKLQLVLLGVMAQRAGTKELFESGLVFGPPVGLFLDVLISLGMLGSQSSVEHDIHPEGPEVDRPGFDQRI
jgi:hypothetical protein